MDLEQYMCKAEFEKALKIKGYGSYSQNQSYETIEKTVKLESGLKVKPKVIKSLSEYFEFISSLESTYKNPVFYRGQTKANRLLIPSSLRKNPANEHLMLQDFTRHFSDEIDKCKTAMAKLVLMQHFGLGCRCLDISENPLAALYFACQPMKKFGKTTWEENERHWGEIVLFREPENDENKNPDKLKVIDSSNVSIMANTAFMEPEFSLWHLGSQWKKDVYLGHDENYIDLKSVVRGSLIVRVPQNNPRIKNQQGAFIIVNANNIYLENNPNILKDLTQFVIDDEYVTVDNLSTNPQWKNFFTNKLKPWEIKFNKIIPYDENNEIKIFRMDPFDLERIFYKNKDGVQQVVLIPGSCKKRILQELERFNITEGFIYPDMDNIANEINEKINV